MLADEELLIEADAAHAARGRGRAGEARALGGGGEVRYGMVSRV